MAISFFEVGRATAAATDTIEIPVGIDVPRSDPVDGATLIYVVIQVPFDYSGAQIGGFDSAITDPFYGTCFFDDGLNHYASPSGQIFGLIVNPLTIGDFITIVFNNPADFIAAGAWAVTGVNLPVEGPQDPALAWLFDVVLPGAFQAAQDLDGSNPSFSAGWFWDPTVHIVKPTGAVTDENWEWRAGDLAFYVITDDTAASDQMGWTWADGSITDFTQWDIDTALGGSHDWWSLAIGTQEPPPSLSAAPSVDGAWGDASSKFFTGGNGFAFLAGPGPFCPPPPVFGNPCFNQVVPV